MYRIDNFIDYESFVKNFEVIVFSAILRNDPIVKENKIFHNFKVIRYSKFIWGLKYNCEIFWANTCHLLLMRQALNMFSRSIHCVTSTSKLVFFWFLLLRKIFTLILSKRVINLVGTQNFLKNQYYLPADTPTYVCVSGVFSENFVYVINRRSLTNI